MITIDLATLDDLDVIMGLEESSFGASPAERWARGSWWAELDRADRDVFLATVPDHDQPVGAITVQTVEQVCDLHRVVVDPAYRRRGVATGLMRAAARAARQRGAAQMMLEVRWDNDPAILAYQRFGFEQLGVRRNYYGPGQDALIMKLYDLAGVAA